MTSPVTYLAVQGLLEAPDWTSLGLVSAIIGCFLIANAILFEHPRRLVQQYFGRKTGRWKSVREHIYNRVQTTLGFGFLLGGFALQLLGRALPAPAATEGGTTPFSVMWVGALVLLAVALLFSGWWWSLWAFRRYVREHFAASPPVFEGDPAMVRELGELFSIEPEANDTVESYAARVRAKVGIPERGGAHRLIPRPVRMNYDDQIEEAI